MFLHLACTEAGKLTIVILISPSFCRERCIPYVTQKNTPPGPIFKARLLCTRINVDIKQGVVGKISPTAFRERACWYWNLAGCGVTELWKSVLGVCYLAIVLVGISLQYNSFEIWWFPRCALMLLLLPSQSSNRLSSCYKRSLQVPPPMSYSCGWHGTVF